MKELAWFASDRKNTTSAWLDSVVIVNQEGVFPSIASIRGLEERVPVVEVGPPQIYRWICEDGFGEQADIFRYERYHPVFPQPCACILFIATLSYVSVRSPANSMR